jgi:hypothetical protein
MNIHTRIVLTTPQPTVSPSVHTAYYFYEDL